MSDKRRFERAKLQGHTARAAGKVRTANPYIVKPSMRIERDGWEAGWLAANVEQGRRRA